MAHSPNTVAGPRRISTGLPYSPWLRLIHRQQTAKAPVRLLFSFQTEL